MLEPFSFCFSNFLHDFLLNFCFQSSNYLHETINNTVVLSGLLSCLLVYADALEASILNNLNAAIVLI